MARGRERRFDFIPSYEDTVEIAEQRNTFDTLFKDVKMFRAKQGANLIRIAPPTWEKAKHYGLLIRLHRDIGPRDRQYLCPKENPSSPSKECPICDALYDLGSRATMEDKRALSPGEAYIYYIIDRDDEKLGLQVWQASLTINSEIAAQCINRRTRAVLNIIDIDKGYDIEFTRTGTTKNNTRYRGFHVMHEPSPFADDPRDFDKWTNELFDRPLTDILNFYSYEHIESVFTGRGREEARSEEEERPRSRSRDDDEEERPRSRSRDRDSEEERPRERTRLSEELDDDIPFDSGRRRNNGRDDEGEEPARRRAEPEPEEEAPRRARARLGDSNGGERTGTAERETRAEERPRRGEEREEERRPRETDDDRNDRSRQRARDMLNRSRE